MILDLSNLNKYKAVVSVLATDGRGNDLSESVYLNFDDGYMYFNSPLYKSRIKFSYENPQHETYENMYFNIRKLVAIVDNFPVLNYDPSTVTLSNPDDERERFRIEHKDQYNDLYEMFEGIYDWDKYIFTPETLVLLSEAINFVERDSEEYNGVMFYDSKLIAMTRTEGVYQADLDEEFLYPLKLSLSIVTILVRLQEGMEASVYRKESQNMVSVNEGEAEIYSSQEVSMELMDDDEFTPVYNHESYIVVPRREVYDVLMFMSTFTMFNTNHRVNISVSEDGSELIIETVDLDQVRRIVKIDDSKYAEGILSELPLDRFKVALQTLKTDFVKIQIDTKHYGINLTEVSEDDESDVPYKHIVLAKIVEEV